MQVKVVNEYFKVEFNTFLIAYILKEDSMKL